MAVVRSFIASPEDLPVSPEDQNIIERSSVIARRGYGAVPRLPANRPWFA